jgi:hypothetical protein
MGYKIMTAIIHIDYDEGDQSTYRAVVVGDRIFQTGDPVVDFGNAAKYAHAHFEYVCLSSDCDNFVFDGDLYRWRTDSLLGEIITHKDEFKQWARANVLTTTSAAAHTGLKSVTIRGAINRGELAAFRFGDTGPWCIFRDDLIAWRDACRKYERNTL